VEPGFCGLFQQTINIIESNLKTIGFGLKPGKYMVFNSPALKGWAIDMRDVQGFSHNNLMLDAFLD